MEMADKDIIANLLANPFHRRSFIHKKEIVDVGRPKPPIPDMTTPHQDKGKTFIRHFNVVEYERTPWLAGSTTLKKLFCWPCLLFAKEAGTSPWTSKEGYGNLNAFNNAKVKHQRSTTHLRSQLHLHDFGESRLELQLDEQQRREVSRHNELVRQNRNILVRLIDSVCLLSKQELAFRGHDEGSESLNRGNYVELLSLIASYDQLLKSHLESATVFRGTSNHIQNDLIDAVSAVVKDKIKAEISSAPFVAILLDETSDVMSVSQLSTVLRYVTKDGKAEERFVGFTDVSADKTAEGLYRHVLKIVEEYNLHDKLVAQSYDGAAVMAGHLNGLCAKVLETFPRALFIHCFAHRLNLVLQKVCSSIKECAAFFLTLNGLAAFFSRSPKRTEVLKAFMDRGRKIPRVAPTRWVFTSRVVNTVWEFHQKLIEFFDYLIETPVHRDHDTYSLALAYKGFLTNFRNVFLLKVFSNLFGHTDVLYNILQTKSLDILYSYQKVQDTQAALAEEREKFDSVWEDVNLRTDACHIDSPRPRRKNQTELEASRQIYFQIIDTICTQLGDRFASMQRVKFISLFNPELFSAFHKKFPEDIFKTLEVSYSGLFDFVLLRNELVVLYSWESFKGKHPHELVAQMHSKGLQSAMSEMHRLGCLILTIPSTTASVERSFSALKRIESHVRASQGQMRLSNLSLLSIEKSILCKLQAESTFHAMVTDVFAKQPRRIDFNFK